MMQTIEEITKYLKENLSEKRFAHTMGVAETAKSLAERWGADSHKAFLAGLVHDCAKEIPTDESVKRLRNYGYVPDSIETRSPALLHAPLGAYMAEELFGITDCEVLDAVRYHTTGRKDMTLLEKIVYVADFTEPGRKYRESAEVREISMADIDAAVLAESDAVIKFTIDKGGPVHTDTIIARNSMLFKRGKTDES